MFNIITHTHIFQEFKKFLLLYIYYKLRAYVWKKAWYLKKIDGIIDSDGCLDYTDPRTIQYDELAWSPWLENEVKTFTLRNRLSLIQDQTLEKDTKYMCVAYATSHGADVTGGEIKKTYLSWKDFGWAMYYNSLLSLTEGAYLIDGAKLAKKKGFIKGYAQVNNTEEIKNSLVKGYPVLVWSNKINYKQTYLKKSSVLGDSYGHCFLIVWYNEKGFNIIDSWGKREWVLLYDHVPSLFNTKLSISNDNIYTKIETFREELSEKRKKGYNLYDFYKEKKSQYLKKEIIEEDWKAFNVAYRIFYKLSNYNELLKGF